MISFKSIRTKWLFLIAALFVVFVFTIVLFFGTSLRKSREAEVRVTLSSIFTAIKAYHKEYGSYADDFKAIGFSPSGDLGAKYFLKESDIPPALAVYILSGEEPFTKSDSFRILAILEKGPEVLIYTMDQDGNMKKRYLTRGSMRRGW